jgi:RNA polymerase sigma-70 factor (ECF subfamily)
LNEEDAQQPSPERLIERAGRGDRSALVALYDRFAPSLLALAMRILRSKSEAEDVVQDAFVRAWREAPSFDRQRGSAAAWLATLARNRAIDVLRARARQSRHSDEQRHAFELEHGDRARSPELDASVSERAVAVRAAIEALSPEQREALELAYFAGLSHSEIAATLGHPLGTVKTRLLSAARRLRDALAEHDKQR